MRDFAPKPALWKQAVAHYDASSFSYLPTHLIDCAILALGNREFDVTNIDDNSAIVGTLELAKLLMPDEWDFERLYVPPPPPPPAPPKAKKRVRRF